jgi:hypothetical protein
LDGVDELGDPLQAYLWETFSDPLPILSKTTSKAGFELKAQSQAVCDPDSNLAS